jgi:hypothetical protein
MTPADPIDPVGPPIVSSNVRLAADGVGHPSIDLLTF